MESPSREYTCDHYTTLGALPDATTEELYRTYSTKREAAGLDWKQRNELDTAIRALTSSRDEYDARLRSARREMDPSSVPTARARQAKVKKVTKREGKAGPKWREYQKAKTPGKKRKLLEAPAFYQKLVGEALQHIDCRLLRRSHDFVSAVATCLRVTCRWPEYTARLQAVIAIGQTRIAALEGVRRDLGELWEGRSTELQPRPGKESKPPLISIANLISIADQLQKLQDGAEKVASTTACIDNLVEASLSDPTSRRYDTPRSSGDMLTEEDMIRQQLAAALDEWCQ